MDIGSKLNNRYTLTARLGQGAMGQVFRAADAQTGQDVALKVIARDLAFDSEMLQRFRREGEALRQLRHPNIVGFFEMFAHEGQNIIVMEYVSGGSLHDLIKRGPLPADRARRIALEISDALTRAHHIGIIHRDLKPENVLLTTDGTPKLTDFGVARLVSEATRLTGTGTQVGTPYYMSPEAWEGKALDAQTDIWSLGVVFYEMLTGQLPFSGDTVVAVMNKVLNTSVPDLRSLRPDAPLGLTRIITRMLCRDKTERYQTMREVAADIERGDLAAPTTPPRSKPDAVTASPASAVQTRLSPAAARATQAQGRPNRLASIAWTLARLGITSVIGLTVIGCLVLVGGAVLLGNILEGIVAGIPFYPNEIGPGATHVFSRAEVESQLNRQTALALPGTLTDLRLTFVPTDTLHVNAKIFGADATLIFRAKVADRLPRVYLVSLNGLPLPLVGDALAGGVNRGLSKIFTQNNLEMVSITFNPDELTLVLNGPGVQRQARNTCVSNQSFRDTFGEIHGSWNTFETAEAKAYIEDGVFVLRAIAPRTVFTQFLSGCSYGDLQITVDAVNPNPGGYIEYGLVFNRKDPQNYSAFLITTTGFYGFEKVTGGNHEFWVQSWTASPLIHTDGQVNQLGLRVEGTIATPSINGQALSPYQVGAASWGNVGLQVGSGDNVDVQVNFDNFSLSMLTEATPFPSQAADPKLTALAATTLRKTPTPQGTPTLTPLQQGLTVTKCENDDLCIVNYNGQQKRLGLATNYQVGGEASWSPDGQQIVFSACLRSEMNRPNYCRDLYSLDINSLKVTEIYRNPLTSIQGLSWSPDGEWIAFVEDGAVNLIRPTGQDRQVLNISYAAIRLAWSPDSQHLALVTKAKDDKSYLVLVIDQNGANQRLVFLDPNQRIGRDQLLITWDPTGTTVVFMDEAAQAWSIQADCQPVAAKGCAETSRQSIKEVPQHWLPDFYPQWAGEGAISPPTSTPAATRTARPATTSLPKRSVNFSWPTGCSPNPVQAGLIVFAYGVGGGSSDPATAVQAIGKDTYGTITVNGQTVPPATSAQAGQAVDSHGRTLEAHNCTDQCTFETYGAIQLGPGQYDVSATWPRADGNPDPRSCTLTVTAP